jgi:predicted PurR-regulated permease PerM
LNEFSAARALYRGFVFLAVIAAAALLFRELIWVLLQLFVASILAAAMTPIVNAFTSSKRAQKWRWRPGRALVVLGLYVAGAIVAVLLGTIVLRAVAQDLELFVRSLPQYAASLSEFLTRLAERYPPLQELNVSNWIYTNLDTIAGFLQGALGGMAGAVGFVMNILGGFIDVLFTLFLALYITVDAPKMRDYMLVFWPVGRQGQVRRVANEMGARLGHWAIGQGLLCLIIGGGAWLGLALIGVPYSVMLGFIWAAAEFVPGIGPFISAIPSILLGFSVSPTVGLTAALFTLAWSQVENNVITPKVMGSAVELHPLVILVALMVGAELLGFTGALVAIPMAATLAVIVDEIRRERLRTQVLDGTEMAVLADAPVVPPEPYVQPTVP